MKKGIYTFEHEKKLNTVLGMEQFVSIRSFIENISDLNAKSQVRSVHSARKIIKDVLQLLP